MFPDRFALQTSLWLVVIVRVRVRGMIPVGTGASGLEIRRSWEIQVPVRSKEHTILPRSIRMQIFTRASLADV